MADGRFTKQITKRIHFGTEEKAVCRQNGRFDNSKLVLTMEKESVNCKMCLGILEGKINLARFKSVSDLPPSAFCQICETEKPIGEMMVAYLRKEKLFRLRPRCKECHNKTEQGNRRDYKRKYLQDWRKKNSKVNKSYWKDNPAYKERARINALRRFNEKHEAILIQGRLNRRGMQVTIAEAEELLKLYGRCYPTPQGLTPAGLKECERIRGTMRRRRGKKLSSFQIRLIVYEDGLEDKKLIISHHRQPIPYKKAAKRLKKYHADQRKVKNENTI